MDLEVLKSYATKAILQTRKLLLIDTHTSTALHNRLCSEILLKLIKYSKNSEGLLADCCIFIVILKNILVGTVYPQITTLSSKL